MDSKTTVLHSMAQKGVEVLFTNKPMICRRASAAGSQQVRPRCFHVGKTKAGHRASSSHEILELVNRKGISDRKVWNTALLQSLPEDRCVSCVV